MRKFLFVFIVVLCINLFSQEIKYVTHNGFGENNNGYYKTSSINVCFEYDGIDNPEFWLYSQHDANSNGYWWRDSYYNDYSSAHKLKIYNSNLSGFNQTIEGYYIIPNITIQANASQVIDNLEFHLIECGEIFELCYDDGEPDNSYSWAEGYIMATRMSPAEYCQILKLKFYTKTDAGDNDFDAEIYHWDGNQPSTLIHSETVTAVDNDWIEVDVSSNNLYSSGDFVVGFGLNNSTTRLGSDDDNNYRSWDYYSANEE